jgi:hypothetical protein
MDRRDVVLELGDGLLLRQVDAGQRREVGGGAIGRQVGVAADADQAQHQHQRGAERLHPDGQISQETHRHWQPVGSQSCAVSVVARGRAHDWPGASR